MGNFREYSLAWPKWYSKRSIWKKLLCFNFSWLQRIKVMQFLNHQHQFFFSNVNNLKTASQDLILKTNHDFFYSWDWNFISEKWHSATLNSTDSITTNFTYATPALYQDRQRLSWSSHYFLFRKTMFHLIRFVQIMHDLSIKHVSPQIIYELLTQNSQQYIWCLLHN